MIKKTNAAIQKKLLHIQPTSAVHNLLLSLGYIDMDDEHYIFVGDYFTVLLMGQGITEHALNKQKAKNMTPEERKRYEFTEQKRLESIEEMQKKNEYIKKMQEQSEQDRKEKAAIKSKTSVANPLTYGANIQRFKQPPPSKGG